jgi:hypothetical protein
MEYHTFKVVVVMWLLLLLSLDVFVPTSAHHLLLLDNMLTQNYLNLNHTSLLKCWPKNLQDEIHWTAHFCITSLTSNSLDIRVNYINLEP